MLTYLMANGTVLDLSGLSTAEAAFLAECLSAYRSDEPFERFASTRTFSRGNPALAPGARVTASNIDHPLFRAVLDLESRLGVRQGKIRQAEGSDVETDPTDDELLSVAVAAGQKGVTRETVYNAVERGEIVATKSRPVRVSSNSLHRWRPATTRQRAGRLSADAKAGRAR